MDTGEVPGYEFEVPRGPRHGYGPRHATGHDYMPPQLRHPAQQAPAPQSTARHAGSGVLAVMRDRNWLVGLAAPILAAVAVGIAVVVISGGGGGNGVAPSALAAGFPPARLAGASFTGTGKTSGTSRVILDAIGASAGTEVAAGAANGGPALWVSADGGSDWTQAEIGGPAPLRSAGTGELAGVAHGRAGWVAVGTTLTAAGGPLVVSSPDARTWTAAGGIAGLPAGSAVAAAVAAGPAGYVIVGHKSAGRNGAVAAAWYAPGLSGWRSAAITGAAGQLMNAVTVTAGGFAAVGSAGTSAAAWLSADGRSWRQVSLAEPAGAARAALEYVAANGASLVAAGTEFTASGTSSPFAEVSADAGATWTAVQLPVPANGQGTGTTVTALTAAAGGFTATGTYLTAAGPEVVVWTLPPGTPVTTRTGWSAMTPSMTPQNSGQTDANAENAITALTADGATLTGVGFTIGPKASGPTLWQSPVRY
jgi:hypothetical protein